MAVANVSTFLLLFIFCHVKTTDLLRRVRWFRSERIHEMVQSVSISLILRSLKDRITKIFPKTECNTQFPSSLHIQLHLLPPAQKNTQKFSPQMLQLSLIMTRDKQIKESTISSGIPVRKLQHPHKSAVVKTGAYTNVTDSTWQLKYFFLFYWNYRICKLAESKSVK